MKRVSYGTYSLIFGVVYLGLMTNLLLAVACLPELVLLLATNPASSWPLCAIVAPLCTPGLTASFTVFREHDSDTSIFRTFVRGWRDTWRRALLLGVIMSASVTVLIVDAAMFSATVAGAVLVPALGVLTIVALAVGMVSLVAVSEAPRARLRDVTRASAYLALRRWYLTAATIVVLALQLVLFAWMPALALGISSAPALYLAWANGRYILAPVLDSDPDDPTPRGSAVPMTKEIHR